MEAKRLPKFTPKKSGLFVRNVLVVLGLCLLIFLITLSFKSKWSRVFNYSIVLASKNKLGLLVIDPVEESSLVLTIPDNMMMPVVGMKGELKASSVWKFGEGEGRPMVIASRTVESFLGTKADGLVYDYEWDGSIEKVSWKMFLKPVITDLPTIDRVRLAWFFLRLRSDQKKFDQVPLRLGIIEKLPDGSEVVLVDRERLAGIREKLINEKLLDSDLRVIVENGTGTSQMGSLAESMIEASGGLVAQVREGDSNKEWCLLSVNKEDEKDILVSWLEEKLDCKKNIEPLANFEIRVKFGNDWGQAYGRN